LYIPRPSYLDLLAPPTIEANPLPADKANQALVLDKKNTDSNKAKKARRDKAHDEYELTQRLWLNDGDDELTWDWSFHTTNR
jgi:hypothetical protein